MTLISLQCSPTELESLFSAINSPDDGGKEKLEETRSLKPVRKPAHQVLLTSSQPHHGVLSSSRYFGQNLRCPANRLRSSINKMT